MKRHFAHPHPTFGNKTTPSESSAWKRSVYYCWWEYLRRNADYIRTCQRGGRGKCAALYKEFGDVTASDFRTWWMTGDRGALLFAEPPTPTIRVIDEDAIILKVPKDTTLVLEVPLNLPITHLVKRFRAILTKRHGGRKGVQTGRKSQARYQVASNRIDVPFLRKALEVLDARKADPSKKLWQIAMELKLNPSQGLKDSDIAQVKVAKRAILAATTSRYIRKAEAAIANVGLGRFPDYSRSDAAAK